MSDSTTAAAEAEAEAEAIPITNKQACDNNRSSEDAELTEIRRAIENHMIVAALIATVTFAACFTLPGGYVQNGGINEGMAVLSLPTNASTNGTFDREMAIKVRNCFKIFVVADSTAMVCSMSAIGIYFLAAFPTKKKKALQAALFYGYFLTMVAMVTMIVAFFAGLLAVLHRPSIDEIIVNFVIFPAFILLFWVPGFFILKAMMGSFAW